MQVEQTVSQHVLTPQVMLEILNGEGITFGEAARLLPAARGKGRTSPCTVWRWHTIGAKAANGEMVKLEAARLGNHSITTRAAVARFAERLGAPATTSPTPKPASPAKAAKRAAAASKRLAAMGA